MSGCSTGQRATTSCDPAKCGPGHATPMDAHKHGARETLLYVPAIVPDGSRPDYLATVDADPASATYSQVIHRLPMPHKADELHHSGWNACSSCHSDPTAKRSLLVLPALGSGRVYGVDVASNPKAPKLAKVVEHTDIQSKTGLTFPHTSHCLASGEVMISCMGDEGLNARGNYLLLNKDLEVKGAWSSEDTPFGYDFWYQPKHNVMLSSGWGAPSAFSKGFSLDDVAGGKYAESLYVWDWAARKVVQTIELGDEGRIPLELRFKHDPSSLHAFVGAALASNLIHLSRSDSGKWVHEVAVRQEWMAVEGWMLPQMPPLITDIIISMNDNFLFLSNWLRGDLVQVDIRDPAAPRVVSRLWLGGLVGRGGPVKVLSGLPDGMQEQPEIPTVKGHKLLGGPQMIQLSLDGKRLYVTNSLFSPWDKQFYPDMVAQGSYMLQIDVDPGEGGMKINHDFYVDFGAEPGGPVLAHEVRYPGGDCTSDIYL